MKVSFTRAFGFFLMICGVLGLYQNCGAPEQGGPLDIASDEYVPNPYGSPAATPTPSGSPGQCVAAVIIQSRPASGCEHFNIGVANVDIPTPSLQACKDFITNGYNPLLGTMFNGYKVYRWWTGDGSTFTYRQEAQPRMQNRVFDAQCP